MATATLEAYQKSLETDLTTHLGVIGITKPNAFIEVITSPVHLTDNLTKKYLIIFYGGTKDISSNESTNGLRSLIDFAQRSITTNVFLLGVPHRCELPSFSRVNTEVRRVNSKPKQDMDLLYKKYNRKLDIHIILYNSQLKHIIIFHKL